RMIAGHEVVTAGTVRLAGHEVTDLPPARRGTAMMFQSYALFPHLSALDNVAFPLKMRGMGKADRRGRAARLLDLVAMGIYAGRQGSRREVWNQPRTEFVARFTGGHNVIPGSGGLVAVRADRLRRGRPGPDEGRGGLVTATVTDVEYQGAFVQTCLAADDGT